MSTDEPERKIQRSATLPKSLVERAKNAVFWTRVIAGEPASYSELTERGIRAEVERLETTYNEGQPFEHGDLRPGPAPGVMQRVAEMRRKKKEADDAAEENSPEEGS